MIEPTQIDVLQLIKVVEMALDYALATVLVLVFAGAVYAAGALIYSTFCNGD